MVSLGIASLVLMQSRHLAMKTLFGRQKIQWILIHLKNS